jgi:ribosomal protein S18 acetylase RimI-like enzyme
MHIRQLGHGDAVAYRALRLRMLALYPDAFTSSYEDEVKKPLAWVGERLEPGAAAPEDFVLGAFAAPAGKGSAPAGDDRSGRASEALVGAIGLNVEPRRKQRHKGFVFGMYVAPEHMSKGIGRALLEACVARARTIESLELLTLSVTATNERARRLYEAAGFTVHGVEERALKIGDAYFAKAHMSMPLCVASPVGGPSGTPAGGRQ